MTRRPPSPTDRSAAKELNLSRQRRSPAMLEDASSRRRLIECGAALAVLTPAAGAHAIEAAQDTITPFKINIPRSELDHLRTRLDRIRWPDKEVVDDLGQGVPLARMRTLVDHWRTAYDWRKVERQINALPQFITALDGVDIHFIHVKSRHADAMPLCPATCTGRGWSSASRPRPSAWSSTPRRS